MTQLMEPVGTYLTAFEEIGRAGGEPEWLSKVRRHAIDVFQTRGFPSTRDEEWRHTSVAPIVETEFVGAGQAPPRIDRSAISGHLLPDSSVAELVFVNGRYASQLSSTDRLPKGARIGSLNAALRSDSDVEKHLARVAAFDKRSFAALNSALWVDGALVVLPPLAVLESPLHLVFVTEPEPGGSPTFVHPRVLVVAGHGSQATIVESYVEAANHRYFTNAVTEFVLGERALVEHYKVQRESTAAYHVATTQAIIARGAALTSHSVSFGGALVRNDIIATLDGEGAECTLYGLYLGDGTRLVDNHTTIDHAQPHCNSREVYKGILAERSRAVFNGRIIVRPDAQKTDAKQTNKALLLSEDAQINTKPELEIFANDVKCTHGAAVGQMDEEPLFYLRSRGLPLAEARGLLIHAFAGEVLSKMTLDPLRARTESALLSHLAGRRASA
jgi:Fe-S cluster assembly protein SufD